MLEILLDDKITKTKAFSEAQQTVSSHAKALCASINDGAYGFFNLIQQPDRGFEGFVAPLSKFDDILILATGGSSLGGQTLCEALRSPQASQKRPTLHFVENIDPESFAKTVFALNPQRTGVLAISKSGSTAETLCQLIVVMGRWQKEIAPQDLARHFVIVTEDKTSPMLDLAQKFQFPVLHHSKAVGGRFSVLSNVGLLPAKLAGIDVDAVLEGAKGALQNFLEGDDNHPVIQGVTLMHVEKKPLHVLMPYCDRLAAFTRWYRQLWAESLGKANMGFTPIDARGTIDQHSQLQLYLDGPRDKLFTLITLAPKNEGEVMPESIINAPDLAYFSGRRMGDLFAAMQKATIDTLRSCDIPTRVIALETLDEHTMGQLFVQFFLETLLMARVMGVNALDQPAVETGKILARENMKLGTFS